MKVMTFAEFATMPDGTIFSYWKPCVSRGLFRKGETINDGVGNTPPSRNIDYFEMDLLPGPRCPSAGNPDPDPEVPVLEEIESRWGMFNYDQLYAVYEEADMLLLIRMLGGVVTERF